MALLWIAKLYWLWIIVGIIILYVSIFRNFNLFGIILGSVVVLAGLIFKKVMASDTIRNRINRNL